MMACLQQHLLHNLALIWQKWQIQYWQVCKYDLWKWNAILSAKLYNSTSKCGLQLHLLCCALSPDMSGGGVSCPIQNLRMQLGMFTAAAWNLGGSPKTSCACHCTAQCKSPIAWLTAQNLLLISGLFMRGLCTMNGRPQYIFAMFRLQCVELEESLVLFIIRELQLQRGPSTRGVRGEGSLLTLQLPPLITSLPVCPVA